MLAEIANESYRFRSSYHAVHSTDENDARFDPTEFMFLDPVQEREREEEKQREAELSAKTDPELADAGW